MAQFDVYELRLEERLVLDVQSDLVSNQLESRLVIPLFDDTEARWPFSRLAPRLDFGGQTYLLATPLMIGMPRRELGAKRGSLENETYTILNAIDFLLTGA